MAKSTGVCVHFFCMVFGLPNVYSLNDTPVAEDFLDMGVVEGDVGDFGVVGGWSVATSVVIWFNKVWNVGIIVGDDF